MVYFLHNLPCVFPSEVSIMAAMMNSVDGQFKKKCLKAELLLEKPLLTRSTVSLHCVAKNNYGLCSVRPTWRTTSTVAVEVAGVADSTTVLVMAQG